MVVDWLVGASFPSSVCTSLFSFRTFTEEVPWHPQIKHFSVSPYLCQGKSIPAYLPVHYSKDTRIRLLEAGNASHWKHPVTKALWSESTLAKKMLNNNFVFQVWFLIGREHTEELAPGSQNTNSLGVLMSVSLRICKAKDLFLDCGDPMAGIVVAGLSQWRTFN